MNQPHDIDEADGQKVNVGPFVSGFEELFNALKESLEHDVSWWRIIGFVDEPKGDCQPSDCKYFEYEFCDQRCGGPDGDMCDGDIYFPLPDGRFLMVNYCI